MLYPILTRVMGEPGHGQALPLGFALGFADASGSRIGSKACFDLLAIDVKAEREPPWARSTRPPVAPARISGMRSRDLGQRQTFFVTGDPQTYVVRMSLKTMNSVVDVSRAQSVTAVAVLGDDRMPRNKIVFDVVAPGAELDRLVRQAPSVAACHWPTTP